MTRFLLLMWLLSSRVLSVLPKIGIMLLYALSCAYTLYILNNGFQNFANVELFYRPTEAVNYAYKYVTWLFHPNSDISTWVIVSLVISLLVPIMIVRVAINLYYITILIATSSVKGLSLGQIMSKARHKGRATTKTKSGFFSRLMQRKAPASSAAQRQGAVISRPPDPQTMKRAASNIKLKRIKHDDIQQWKLATLQDVSLPQGKCVSNNDSP